MNAEIRCGKWQAVLADVTCNALICDAPYSAKTHAGHDGGASSVNQMRDFVARNVGKGTVRKCDLTYAKNQIAKGEPHRRELGYGFLTPDDVREVVASWSPRTSGWFVSITDDVLAPAWMQALADAGRYVFAPLPFVAPGSRVRLTGDGPSNWTCWIVVARPKTREFSRWGTLPGAYVLPAGQNDRAASESPEWSIVGGKPLWLMRSLVMDYSRPGDTVCDPFAGAATTLVAARLEGRHSIGSECDPATYAKAQARLARPYTPTMFADQPPAVQAELWGAV